MNDEFGAQIPEGGMRDRVSEHVASVGYLVYMMSSVLRYRRGGLGDRVSEHVANVEYLI